MFSRIFRCQIMYQAEGTIWVLVRILSTKWTHISVKKVQTLQSTVLSRILLARDYEDIMISRTRDITQDHLRTWVVSAAWRPFRRSAIQPADQ